MIFDPNAAKNPVQLKVISDVDASATPAMMGANEATIAIVGCSPKNNEDKMTLKKGSAALTVCVKEGATARSDTLVRTLPRTWMQAKGVIALMAPGSMVGRFKMPVSHIVHAMSPPMANWMAVHVMG